TRDDRRRERGLERVHLRRIYEPRAGIPASRALRHVEQPALLELLVRVEHHERSRALVAAVVAEPREEIGVIGLAVEDELEEGVRGAQLRRDPAARFARGAVADAPALDDADVETLPCEVDGGR